MVKIIGISGRKQAGKNTVANYINGRILKEQNMVLNFNINTDGQLEIQTTNSNNDTGWGIFDVTRKDESFVSYAESEMWPFVKLYHFADYLKQMCIDLFDLKPEQVYGTDEDKNTPTEYSQNGWNHKMTAREFLQYFGTDVMRKIKDTVWVDYTIKTILQEQSKVALIPDVRFPNEVKAIQEAGGLVIRLDRDVYKSTHMCESSLDESVFDWNQFDFVIPNQDGSVQDLISKISHIESAWRQ
tara:strand:- start:1305 stop:2030 length:726 start_codon:yes stop_codon:yes gene_type:complete